jgi:transposase
MRALMVQSPFYFALEINSLAKTPEIRYVPVTLFKSMEMILELNGIYNRTNRAAKLLTYFIPVYDAIVERSVAAQHWHADETGWKVFETMEGKKSHRWFLWIFHNKETVVYKMHPTRSSQVLIEYFGEKHSGGILNVDRYSAYKVIAKSGLFTLAFCWAHVRRDFLEHAKGYVNQEAWALAWVDRIGNLYHINNLRIQYRKKLKTFRQHDQRLRKTIIDMREELDKQRVDTSLLPSAKKVLRKKDLFSEPHSI